MKNLSQGQTSLINTKSINILLVEDDEVDIMNVKRALKRVGSTHPLYEARNGLEALKVLRGKTYDKMPIEHRLVFLDLDMPRMNGIEFLRELRDDPDLRGIPVIVLTTSDADRDLMQAYNLNVAGYIVKSMPFDRFVRALEIIISYWTLSEIP